LWGAREAMTEAREENRAGKKREKSSLAPNRAPPVLAPLRPRLAPSASVPCFHFRRRYRQSSSPTPRRRRAVALSVHLVDCSAKGLLCRQHLEPQHRPQHHAHPVTCHCSWGPVQDDGAYTLTPLPSHTMARGSLMRRLAPRPPDAGTRAFLHSLARPERGRAWHHCKPLGLS
jgi:hypothetical protein